MQSNLFLQIGLNHYLFVAIIIFIIGLLGVLWRRNIISILMSLELMLNAINLILIAFGKFSQNINSNVLVLFIITIAAVEVTVGIGICIVIFKKFNSINLAFFDKLKG